jgi:glycosyltransferase involved in cell wall biosynthesis
MYLLKDDYLASKPTRPKRTINGKHIFYSEHFLHNGKDYRVCQDKLGVYSKTMQRIIEQFEVAQAKWKRVFVYRFDAHLDNYTPDNEEISRFISRLFKRLKRTYGFKNIGYCWAREQERAKSQHYHFVLFLDGDLIQYSSKLFAIIRATWEKPTGGYTVPIIKTPFYYVDNEEEVQKAIYRASYLAKTRGKGYRPPRTNDFNSSQMKANRK